MSSFSIALSGLTASSSDLSVTANNIANADTVGFKGSRAEFGDVYATGAVDLNTSISGEGVQQLVTAQQFTQGNISTTSSNLDLAISGDGFFTTSGANGLEYTRNGEFSENANGDVVSTNGEALQVYPALAAGGFNTGALSNLNLQTAQSAPAATTAAAVILNLPAGAATPTEYTGPGSFSATNSQTYNQSTSTTIYDSLGDSHSATMYFTALPVDPTATPPVPADTWGVNMTIDGTSVGAQQTMTFTTGGALSLINGATPTNSGAINFSYNPPGANPQTIAFQFASKTGASTQYGGSFGVTSITQNGYATGQLSTVAIDSTGIVSAVYTNGRTTELGQLAMANFPNTQGLKQLGDTSWAATYDSGDVVQGTAGSAGFGSIQAGALESSNVDLTTDLVNMITAQREFDSNAQVITTANQESQTVIQISH
jgi:flagellar hook protein FlgE